MDIDVQAADQKLIAKALKDAPKYSPDHTLRALHDIFDVEERALIWFILLGQTAKDCKENKQNGCDMIEMALPKTNLTYEVKSLFESTWKFTPTAWGYEYFFPLELHWDTKIPVRIYIYNEHFKLFDNPNRVWGTTENFLIPNPFDEYWKARYLIRNKLVKGLPLSSQKL